MDYSNIKKEKLIKILKEKDNIIENLNRENKELQYYATRDAMTGIFNRRFAFHLLRKEIHESKASNATLTVCFVDVNGLKYVNDTFGHREGDKLILNVSGILKSSIRKMDIVSRIGGDEFLIIFPKTTINEAEKVWNRIHKKIDKMNKNKDHSYDISLSHGFSEYKGDIPISIEKLIHHADEKMYKEKYKRNIQNMKK